MNEMVERVAKAIYVSQFGTRLSGDLSEPECKIMALAAIKAMREPTDAMVEHAWMTVPNTIEAMAEQPSAENQIAAFWQAMIDEALK